MPCIDKELCVTDITLVRKILHKQISKYEHVSSTMKQMGKIHREEPSTNYQAVQMCKCAEGGCEHVGNNSERRERQEAWDDICQVRSEVDKMLQLHFSWVVTR